MHKIVVMISGNGSNLQAIIDSINSRKTTNVTISCVISNKSTAFGLTRAINNNIPTKVFNLKEFASRTEFDAELATFVSAIKPDLVVLAGWMLILSSQFLDVVSLECPIINLHPALPNMFNGANAIKRSWDAYKSGEINHTGVMVHHVISKVDEGQPILTRRIDFKNGDTLDTFSSRLHEVEHEAIVEAIKIVLKLNPQ